MQLATMLVAVITSLVFASGSLDETRPAELKVTERPLLTVQYDGPYSRSTLGVSVKILLDEHQDPILITFLSFGEQGRIEEQIDLRAVGESCSFTISGKSIIYEKPVFHFRPGSRVKKDQVDAYQVSIERGKLVNTEGELPGPTNRDDVKWVVDGVLSTAHMLRELIPYSQNWGWIDGWIQCVHHRNENEAME